MNVNMKSVITNKTKTMVERAESKATHTSILQHGRKQGMSPKLEENNETEKQN